MDPRLKERLIGAAVLVALGVWLIPWILDGRDPQPAQTATESAAQLPDDADESVQLRTRTIDLERRPGGAGAQPVAAQATDDTVAVAAAPDEITDDPATVAGGAQSTPQVTEPIAARPIDEQSAPTADAESAPPDPPARPAANVRNDADGWVVQLGSFRDRDNADRQAARVTTYGFEPAVSVFTAGGQSMYRVRVGPYDSRGRADETASTLSANGFVAQVVAN